MFGNVWTEERLRAEALRQQPQATVAEEPASAAEQEAAEQEAASGAASRAAARAASRVTSAAVTALVQAVDEVLAQVPVELPEAQALADTAELLTQVERLRAGLLGRVAMSMRASSTGSTTPPRRPRGCGSRTRRYGPNKRGPVFFYFEVRGSQYAAQSRSIAG